MKSTGIVRKVDELGRIVLPIELRRTMGIEVKDALEIYVDGDHIVLKKYEPSCVFCGNAKDIIHFKGKNVCSDCAHALGKSVFLFFTASLRRFGAVFRLCCSAAAYVPLLLVHLQNGLYALIQLGI